MNNFRGCIFGTTGSGKSYHAREFISTFLDEKISIVIYDPIADGDFAKFFEPHGFSVARNLDAFAACVNRAFEEGYQHTRLVYWPNGANKKLDAKLEFETVAGIVSEWKNVLFVVDEADMFCKAGDAGIALNWILNYGRHNSISLILLSRRPQQLPRLATSQSSWIRSFHQHEIRDLKYMECLGFDPDALKNLPPRESLIIIP